MTLRERYRTRRLFRWAVELLGLALVLTGVGLFQARHHLRGALPAARFQTLDGASAGLTPLDGRPTLLEVWAPACPICRLEADNLSRARRWLGARAHVVSLVTAFDDVAEVKQAMAAQHVDYPVLVADDAFVRKLGVEAFPTLFVLDGQGRVVTSVQGYTTTLGLVLRVLWAGA